MTDVSIINRVTAVQITYSGGTVELQAPPIRRAPSTTDAEAAVAMTRAQAVARLADGWVPPAFFVAGGRLYAYRGPGVTAISDMPGCVPFGAIIFPDQFGLPTTGDDILRIEEMAAYAASVAASTGGCVIEAWGCKSKISRTFAPQNWTGVVFRGYQFEVHSAWSYTPGATIWGNPLAFPDWNAFTARCLMYLGPGSGQPTIEYCSFNGIRNGVCRANGILHSNGSSIIRYNSIIRVPDFGYWNTNGNDQEVYANRIIQWDQSSPENQDASKCTAVPVVIASGDCTVRDNLIGYGKFSAVFHGTAGRFEGNHLVCGMPDNATGTAAQAPRYNVWITSSGGPELSNNQYDKGGILSDCSAWASQGDKFHLDCKYNNVLLPMVCFRPIGANDKIRGLVLTGAACIGKKVVLGVTKDRESGDWFTVDETYGTLATDTDNPNTIIADNVYKSGESATQPIPSTRGARIFVYRSDAWTQDPVTGLWSTAAFDFSAPMFLPTRFPWHPADMTANIKSLAGSPTYGRMVARKVQVGRYYLEARWNAPPDVTHLLVKWDYTNLRREIIGEAPNDADSHEIELFCAPEPLVAATLDEAAARAAAGDYDSLPDSAKVIFGGPVYMRLASASASAGIPAGFVPDGYLTLDHWMGATTQAHSALQAAVDYASSVAGDAGGSFGRQVPISLLGKGYEIGAQIDLSGRSGVLIRDGGLQLTANLGAAPMFNCIKAGSVKNSRFGLERVYLDLNWNGSGVLLDDVVRPSLRDVIVRRMAHGGSAYGVKTTTKATEAAFDRVSVFQYKWGESGFDVQANRDSTGFDMNTADWTMSNCVAAYCGVPFHKGAGWNWQMSQCHFYQGFLSTVSDPLAIYNMVIDNPEGGIITNLYNDNGCIKVNCDNLAASVGGMLIMRDVNHVKNADANNTYSLELVNNTAANEMAGLVLGGHSFPDNATNVRMTGSGSLPEVTLWRISGCRRGSGYAPSGGVLPLFEDGFMQVKDGAKWAWKSWSDVVTMEFPHAMTLRVDGNADGGDSQNVINFAFRNGTHYTLDRSAFSPAAASARDLGATALPWRDTFTDRLALTALTSDPASPVNGQVWLNATTGQLKARIGGVTKVFNLT